MQVRAEATVRDYGWMTLAVVMGGLAALNVVACVVAAVRGDLLGLVRGPLSGLFGYWMAVGAWRRTVWGLVLAEVPADSGAGGRRLILTALACCVALAFALALQVVAGRT